MDFKTFYQKFKKNNFIVFSLEDVNSFFPEENSESIKKSLWRWKKKGWISALKRGCYELAFPQETLIPDTFIANKLYSPSYVSLETALSHYSIIPEVAMAVTSLSPKPTRTFKNKHGLFLYRTIKPVAFCGYTIERVNNFDVLLAEPEKALIDYLYFKTLNNKAHSFKEERFDAQLITALNKNKLKQYALLYNLNLEGILC